jgi:SAM-dependent methyltransferase
MIEVNAMNHTEPPHPGNRDDDSVAARASFEPGLEDMMARIRLELTGSAEDVLQTTKAVGGFAAERADSVEPARVLSIDEVINRVRRELKQRRGDASSSEAPSATALSAEDRLPRWQSSVAALPLQSAYALAEMLRSSDSDFVDNAFRILLRRPANADEKARYLTALRSGGISKVEILGNIRFSHEGMQHGVHIDGLLIPYKLHKWRRVPVLGWFLATGIALFRLPGLFAHLQKLEATNAQEIHNVGRALNDVAKVAETRQAHLNDQFDVLGRGLRRLETTLSEQMSAFASTIDRLDQQLAMQASTLAQAQIRVQQLEQLETEVARLGSVRTSLSAQVESSLEKVRQLESRLETGLPAVAKMTVEDAETRRAVRDVERQVMALFDRMNQQASGSPVVVPSDPGKDQVSTGLLDAHYVSFEDTFRGSRDDIKARAEHYLATFREAGVQAGDGLILDIGCGRGEWLEVLFENGYACRGVDLNRVMVGEALALGLDVTEQDAVAYLRGLGSESVSAVTSMHLVEHLPYEILIRLLDEALRVLRPGGVLILETPNPENLRVSSYWFYMDPTHRNPIPPALLQWVVEARGFDSVTVDRLTRNRGVFDIQPVDESVAGASQINKIVELMTAAPDYAIVARKPCPEAVHGQDT